MWAFHTLDSSRIQWVLQQKELHKIQVKVEEKKSKNIQNITK